jgi:hypothetical protein
VGAKLFNADRYTDGRTDGQMDMTKLMVVFRNLSKALKNCWNPSQKICTRLKNCSFRCINEIKEHNHFFSTLVLSHHEQTQSLSTLHNVSHLQNFINTSDVAASLFERLIAAKLFQKLTHILQVSHYILHKAVSSIIFIHFTVLRPSFLEAL